jgi:hypothetical protein
VFRNQLRGSDQVQDYPNDPTQVDLDATPTRTNSDARIDARITAVCAATRDPNLSLAARGLYATIASYPQGVSPRTLRKHGPESLPILRELLAELRAHGYVEGGEQ